MTYKQSSLSKKMWELTCPVCHKKYDVYKKEKRIRLTCSASCRYKIGYNK